MNITPNRLTIAQLFATHNEQFVVPSYQRRYAWGYHQYSALYEDIDMLKENDGHLFGMIILHTSYHTAGINQPELVDGQQRMTTLVVFLKAFEIVYRNMRKEEKANEIRRMLLCKGLDDIEKPKIKLGDLDNPDLEQLLLHSESGSINNDNIKSAFNHYIEWLSELKLDDLNKLYYKLTNIAVIIRLDVSMAKDAFKLFETINNRGLRLKPTDIVKNFLLGHAAKINQVDILDKVKDLWSKIIINLDNLDSDDFLRQFMCSVLQRKITMSNLVYEFKKFYLKNIDKAELLGEFEYYQDEEFYDEPDDDDLVEDGIIDSTTIEDTRPALASIATKQTIVEFLQKLNNLSSMYRQISLSIHPSIKINRRIRNLNNILSKPSYIFLMHFLLDKKYSEKEQLNILEYLETLMLRRHICERRTSENDDIFSKAVSFLKGGHLQIKLSLFISEHEYMPSNHEFEESFPKHQFKGRLIDRAKYILETIEYYKRGNTEELTLSSSSEVHLEHIIPQTINTKKSKDEFGDWVSYLGHKSLIKHKKYVNYIGNMTLLGEALNIKAYNNPFAKKKDSYKKSSFLITTELGTQTDFKFSHLDKRSENICKMALEIWKVS